jgi:4-diphosphocytidyl-2-C-methyl-D-erythritol kinase
MILFPNAKINLGLKVLRKRQDGYHDIETLFYPVPVHDILEVTKTLSRFNNIPVELEKVPNFTSVDIELNPGIYMKMSTSGIRIDGEFSDNLCVKAIMAFNKEHPLQHNYFIHLHKIIPTGSGLGGGSSNASFTLKALNEIEGFPFSDEELSAIASTLGSDCPFFILNRTSLATGRGEVLIPVNVSLQGYYVLIVIPPVHVNTADAFNGIIPSIDTNSLLNTMGMPVEKWNDEMRNDFENSIFKKFPVIGEVKQKILECGAIFASMSGSGSAVYGLFKKRPLLQGEFSCCTCFETEL